MKYPNFLKKNDNIGVTALSSGAGDNLIEVKNSFNNLKKDYHLIVTPNVYGNDIVSSDTQKRVEEFNNLLDEDIQMLFNIRGGDFLTDTLPFLNYEKILKKSIWFQGYSDITNLLYILTVKYDLATIYGLNGKSYDIQEQYVLNNLEIMKGHLVKQESFSDQMVLANHNYLKSDGLLLGGCLDTLRYLFGTSYDKTLSFIEKYQKKKIIWYFDIFSMGSVDVYQTLIQMNRMGYFKYTDTIIFGKVLFPKIECQLDYFDAYKKALDKNIILDAPIGHVKPVFTIINGSIGHILYKDNKLSLEMELMDESNG